MADKRFNLTFNVNANIDPIKAAANGLQQAFGKLKLSDSLQLSLDKTFSKLNNEIQNFESLTSKGFTNLGDISKAEKSFIKITDLLEQLKNQSKSITGLEPEKFLPKESIERVNSLRKSWGDLKKIVDKGIENNAKIKAQNSEIKRAEQAVQNLTSQYNKLNSENRSLSSSKGINTKQINEYKIQIEETRKAQEQLLESGEKQGGTKYQDLERQVKNANTAIAQLEKTNRSYDTTIQKNKATMNGLKTEISSTSASVTDMKNELTKLQDEAKNPEGLAQLRQQLAALKNTNIDKIPTDLEEIKQVIDNLNSEELKKITQNLKEIDPNLKEVSQAADKCGDSFDTIKSSAQGFDQTAREIENLHNQVLQFFSIGNAVQLFKRAVNSAFDTVKELDATMTETATVTEFSVSDMWKRLPIYSAEATKLGAKINDLYAATTLYYQQGLNTNQSMAAGIETIKMARIAAMDATEATNLMTAALRGFNMEVNEANATRVNDVYSELAAITAADTQEIGTAMSKTASIANSANMEFETTAALLSQIIETTREAPETAGTAMKTIIARFTEMKKLYTEEQLTSGIDAEGEAFDINKIDTALKSVGMSLQGFMTGTQGIDDVLLELASKWDTLDISTQRYIATQAAGSRQQSRFLAMMSNYDRTMELVDAAYNSAGSSQEQFEKTLDSLNSKLTKLKNAWDQFAMGLANNDFIKSAIDILTELLNTLNFIIDTISGGNGVVKSLVSLGIAFSVFKGIKNLLNGSKFGGSIISNLFGGKGKPEAEAGQIGKQAGHSFSINFKKQIKNVKDKGLFKGLFSKDMAIELKKGADFSQVYNGLDDAQKIALSKNENFKKAFLNQIQSSGFNKEQQIQIKTSFDEGGLDSAIKKVNEFGKTIKVSEDMSNQASETIDVDFNKIANAAGVVGAAIMGLASMMESMGASQEAVDVVRALGTALMTLPVIFNVVQAAAKVFGINLTATIAKIPIIGWIAAAISLFITLIGIISSFNETDTEKLERLEEQTKKMEEAASKASTAFDELKSSLENINELDTSLDNLVYGTEAWNEALLKVNEQILNLIDKYPELVQYVTTGEYGELELNEQGQEDFKKLQQKRLEDSQQAALIAKAYQTDFDLSLKKEQFETQVSRIDTTSGELVGGKENAEAITKAFKNNPDIFMPKDSISYQGILDLINNGQIEQAQKIWENASYEETKGYDWSQVMNNQNDDYNAILSNWEGTVNQYDEELLNLAKETGLTASALSDMSSDINSYNLSVGVAEKQISSFVKNAIDTNLSEETKKSQYANQVSTGLSNKSVEDINIRADELQSNKNGSDNITKLAKEKQENGSEIITSTDNSLETYKQVYQELSGMPKEQISELEWSKEKFANAIASYDIADKYKNNAENIIKTLDNISKKDKKGANEAAALLTSDFSSLDKEQIDALKSLDENALRNKLDDYGILSKNATDEEVKNLLDQLGVENFSAWIKDIQKTAEGSSKQFSELSGNFSSKTEEGYETTRQQDFNTLIENKTFGESQNIADALNMAESETGREGFDFAKKIIEDIYNNPQLLEGERKNLLDILSQGFETPKDIEDYLNTLQEFDPTITDEDLKNLQDQFKNAYNVIETFDLNNFRENLKSTLDTIDNLKNRESLLFNDEEYNALIKAGANKNDFMFNGQEWTYLGGSLDSLAEELQKNTSALLNNTLALLKRQIASGQTFANAATEYQDVEGIDEFLSGGLTDANKIAEMYAKIGITSLTDPETNIEYSMEQLANDEDLLRRLYTEQATNYINLGANKNKLEDIERSTVVAGKTGDEVRMAGGTQEEQITATLSTAKEAGLNTSELIAYRDTLVDITEESKEVSTLSKAMATEIAKDNMLMNQAISKLSANWDTWSVALKNSNKNTPEYAAALSSLRNNMKNMLGITADLSEKFLTDTKNMELMAKAAKGDVKAIETLRKEAAKAILFSPQINFTGFEKQKDILNDLINQDFSEIPIGTQLDDSYIDAFNELIDAGVMTADEVNQVLEAIGYNPQIEYEDIEVNGANKQRIVANGGFNQLQPDGSTKWVPINNETNLDTYAGSTVQVPVINSKGQKKLGGATFKGAASKTASPSNKGPKGGGGGGGSKKEDTKTWKNPYDEFYNTTEKINELLRQRNKLENEFGKLASRSATTTEQLNKNLKSQLKNLESQVKSQKILINGKRKQLQNATNATMSVKEGKTISFQQAFKKAGGAGDISQYGYYDEKQGQIIINWDRLEALQKKDAEQGEAVEAYISYLEDISGKLEEAQDALTDIEDGIIAIIDEQLEARNDLTTTLRDALIQQYQNEIDKLSELNDTINESNTNILNGIQESVELSRQIRDNTETEQDIAEKEAKLAFLRRDTSGANDLEIKQLEEELKDARQSYSDTLVDQELGRLSKQNDDDAEARQKQIDLMQKQLDYWTESGYFNDQVNAMIEAVEGSPLANKAFNIWKEMQEYDAKTETEKIALMKEWNELWKKGRAGSTELAAADSMYKGEKYTLVDASGASYGGFSYDSATDTWSNGNISISGSDISGADTTRNTLSTQKDFSIKDTSSISPDSQPENSYPYGKASETSGNIKQGARGNAVKAIQYALNQLGFGNSGTKSVDGIFGSNTTKAVRAFQRAMGIRQDGIVGSRTREKFRAKQYKAGGLADYTGMAWLDGTKSKPELILNAKDTENFIVLKDVLSDVLKGSLSQTKNSGDNYYDFHITVEQIANDYDVERMIQKVKDEINKDATYRNVNSINFMR